MKFFKPKFWDKNQISFFAIVLFPFELFTFARTENHESIILGFGFIIHTLVLLVE